MTDKIKDIVSEDSRDLGAEANAPIEHRCDALRSSAGNSMQQIKEVAIDFASWISDYRYGESRESMPDVWKDYAYDEHSILFKRFIEGRPYQGIEPQQRWLKVGDYITELLPEDYLDQPTKIQFGSEYQLEITKVNGELKVTNGVNGWGNNCKDEWKDAEVILLIREQTAQECDASKDAILTNPD